MTNEFVKRHIGARPLPERKCEFRVWAPNAHSVDVRLVDSARVEPLAAEGDGYFAATIANVGPNTPYVYRMDGGLERPDPASRLQAEGVHGPSRVVDLAYPFTDAKWKGTPLSHYVIYELHVGTFTSRGNFDGIVGEIARLRKLGITAIELMPVAQYPGARNWGYDGVYPFAVQDSYGGASGLQYLVDECHRQGMAVILDVVYNHMGPEGNYLRDFGPYFTDAYKTPWGQAINFDGIGSDHVRRFFVENALQWVEDFHIDALRLDAVHAIYDRTATTFLEELSDVVHRRARELGRNVYLIAESDLNDPRLVRPSDTGGYGLDSMWCDDFHHAAHVLLTGERGGYYRDFGKVQDLANACRWAMSRPGQYSELRKRNHGRKDTELRPEQCVVCIQNHDQIGNRMLGERLGTLVDFEREKLAAGLLCLCPFLPLLFMGQEYGETAPFQYWVSHQDPELIEAVRRGRREEFASFNLEAEAPDPAAAETYQRCVLNHELRHSGRHAVLYRLYEELLKIRATHVRGASGDLVAFESNRVLLKQDGASFATFSFSPSVRRLLLPVEAGSWTKLIASADEVWGGPGSALPAVLDTRGEVELELQPYAFSFYMRQQKIQ